MLFARPWLLLILPVLTAAEPAFSCPYCRIENHLHTAVQTAEHIAVVKVLTESGPGHWHTEIQELVKNDTKNAQVAVGKLLDYGDPFHVGQAGKMMLAVGKTYSPEAADNDLLPLDLLPEIQRLLRPNSHPTTADEAAEYLTSVCCYLHQDAIGCYKRHPLPVQEALLRRIHALENAAAVTSAPGFVSQQLRCGLVALLRNRTVLSDEQMQREIDGFLHVSKQPRTPEALYLSMARLESVFSIIAEQPPKDKWRDRATLLLASVRGQQLSRVCQCLIISGLMTPEDLLRARPAPEDAAWIRQAVVLAGIGHFNAWDDKTAATLAQSAAKIPGSSASSELAALTSAVENKERYISPPRTGDWETPDDAGWHSYSHLFDAAAWDKIPEAPFAERTGPRSNQGFAMLAFIFLSVVSACLLWLVLHRLRKPETSQ